MYRVRAVRDTVLKRLPLQSAELAAEQKRSVPAGWQATLAGPPQVEGQHLRLQVLELGPAPWYAFRPHVEIEVEDANNRPQDTPPRRGDQLLRLPWGEVLQLDAPIWPGGHFSWWEATHGGTRVPEEPSVLANIRRVAAALEEVRLLLGGQPLRVTSWYRPAHINRAVGGAPNSRHLVGDAVDFAHVRLSPQQVYEQLHLWWGSRGGLAAGRGFVHIDCRGYAARWRYP